MAYYSQFDDRKQSVMQVPFSLVKFETKIPYLPRLFLYSELGNCNPVDIEPLPNTMPHHISLCHNYLKQHCKSSLWRLFFVSSRDSIETQSSEGPRK